MLDDIPEVPPALQVASRDIGNFDYGHWAQMKKYNIHFCSFN